MTGREGGDGARGDLDQPIASEARVPHAAANSAGELAFPPLYGELNALFGRGVDRPWSDRGFNRCAMAVFAHQLETNPIYRRFAEAGGSPDRVEHWSEVPAVPSGAFKHVRLVSGDPSAVRCVFKTSGTTASRPGEHHVIAPELYRGSLVPNFRANLLADGARLPVLSLIPAPRVQPHSSLSVMVETVMTELGAEGSGWFLDPAAGIDEDGLLAAFDRARTSDTAVLLVGTAFAFVHWLDGAMERSPVRLPEGSRIMETGGFKGRSREMGKAELYRALQQATGVPPERIVNEYGMTELLSQFYEPVLRLGESPEGPEGRAHVPPPWVRTRVLDPDTLDPCAEGRVGILAHFDLANVGSVAHVLTEDLGVEVEGGFRVVGRALGAEARGCSLAMDELLSAIDG